MPETPEGYFDVLGELYVQALNSDEAVVVLNSYEGVFALAGQDAEELRFEPGAIKGFIGGLRERPERARLARETWQTHLRATRRRPARVSPGSPMQATGHGR
jgi:hypothetical protein